MICPAKNRFFPHRKPMSVSLPTQRPNRYLSETASQTLYQTSFQEKNIEFSTSCELFPPQQNLKRKSKSKEDIPIWPVVLYVNAPAYKLTIFLAPKKNLFALRYNILQRHAGTYLPTTNPLPNTPVTGSAPATKHGITYSGTYHAGYYSPHFLSIRYSVS